MKGKILICNECGQKNRIRDTFDISGAKCASCRANLTLTKSPSIKRPQNNVARLNERTFKLKNFAIISVIIIVAAAVGYIFLFSSNSTSMSSFSCSPKDLVEILEDGYDDPLVIRSGPNRGGGTNTGIFVDREKYTDIEIITFVTLDRETSVDFKGSASLSDLQENSVTNVSKIIRECALEFSEGFRSEIVKLLQIYSRKERVWSFNIEAPNGQLQTNLQTEYGGTDYPDFVFFSVRISDL